MPKSRLQPPVDREAIDGAQSQIVVACVIALAFLVVTFLVLRPPPTAIIVVAIVVTIGIKKAAVRYRALERAKAEPQDSI